MSRLHRDLRERSEFLAKLEAAERESPAYEIVPYVRRGDWIVGTQDAAPHAQTARWVDTPPMQDAHIGASRRKDRRRRGAAAARGGAVHAKEPVTAGR